MIRRHRRYWAPAVGLLLALPLIVSLAAPDTRTMSNDEKRNLAPSPKWPESRSDWLRLPGRTEAFLNDHFGLRHAAIHAYALLTQRLLHSGNEFVLFGRDGWMFYLDDDMVTQSAGLVRRDAQLARTADMLMAMKTVLAANGERLLVAVPPNSSTIYREQVPAWARNQGRRTEYDVFLDDLAARGVRAIDLRPALREARGSGYVYYRTDTHWTARGAVAGFNALVQADGHPDWTVEANDALKESQNDVGGDLAGMLGIADDITEPDRKEREVPDSSREELDHETETYVATSGKPGPTIMVIGDSFTEGFFLPLVLRHASRMVWLHHARCGFDWKWVEAFHPDEVWYMPTERLLPCEPDSAPKNLPRQ